jgi:hypothetical protein
MTKALPIGVSTFESIIKSNALYVDKTEVLYNLIYDKIPKRYFFSRPRRFGKSLTCSTLNAIFSGRNLFHSIPIPPRLMFFINVQYVFFYQIYC